MRLTIFAALLAASAAPALAQTETALPDPESIGDVWTVALGVGTTPDYTGSNDYRLIPAVAIRGRVGGIGITTRSTYLYLDLVPRGAGSIDIDAGPVAGVRLNRTSKIKDDIVDLLPERRTAIEVGGFAGASIKGVTNPYDSLGVRVDVLHDVGNAHESTVVSPSVDFSTPLSRSTYVSLSAGLEFVADRFADTYFSISPADSLASGLDTFDADGGLKNWKLGLLANQSLSGDLTRGLSVFGIANYSRLVGDFKRSPIVADRGSANQWLLAAGLAYSW